MKTNINEIISVLSLLNQLSEEQQKEIYYMSKGALFINEQLKTEKKINERSAFK